MIEKLIQTDVNTFDLNAVKVLKKYFDCGLTTTCSDSERELWFYNLLQIAQHSVGMAHCVQHNQIPRFLVESHFQNSLPACYKDYSEQIASQSGWKFNDTLKLNGNVLSGTKHWISNLHNSDFTVVRAVDDNHNESYVLIDLTQVDHKINLADIIPIGLELANPGSVTVDHVELPSKYIWGQQNLQKKSNNLFHDKNLIEYSFITTHLGCNIALYNELKNYPNRYDNTATFELNKMQLAISSLKMMWQDNLASIHQREFTVDEFWHRRHTQYTQSKNIMLQLINLVLQMGDSRWLDVKTPASQRFRDALIFSSHMGSLYKSLEKRHFVKF
jgi:hypothetical protein